MVQGSTDPWQQENLRETTTEQSDQALSDTANVPGTARLEPTATGVPSTSHTRSVTVKPLL